MGRKASNGYVQRTFRLKAETVKLLDEYSKRTGVTRTFAVEKAIQEYLAQNSSIADNRTGGNSI